MSQVDLWEQNLVQVMTACLPYLNLSQPDTLQKVT